MTLQLRPYQQACLDGVYEYLGSGKGWAPYVEVPTGGGKSFIMAKFCMDTVMRSPHVRIAVMAHVKELISQNYQELLGIWPEAPAGVYSAGHGRREAHKNITFCSIQTVHNKINDMQWLDIILVDEAQMVNTKKQGMYRDFISKMKKINPRLVVLGLSATPYRLSGGYLHQGEEALFDGLAYKVDILGLVDSGYLAPLISKDVKTHLDTSSVPLVNGELHQGKLQIAVDRPDTNKAIAWETVHLGEDRKCWLVFGAGVDHCNNLRDEIKKLGIDAECVFGDTPKKERKEIIEAHKSLDLRCLVTRFVAAVGYNNKAVDLIADAAPTESPGLHVQKLGRGTRTFPGKDDCLVLGYASNVERHGPIDKVRPKQPARRMSKEEKDMLKQSKECPDCESVMHISIRECPTCGWLFGDGNSGPKLDQTASTLSPMSGAQPSWLPVNDVIYSSHEARSGKGTTLKVQYLVGLKSYPKWILLEHKGAARRNAENWWLKHAGTTPPSNVEEALERKDELRTPSAISVMRSGKHWDVVDAQ